jgi:hypothetical protein
MDRIRPHVNQTWPEFAPRKVISCAHKDDHLRMLRTIPCRDLCHRLRLRIIDSALRMQIPGHQYDSSHQPILNAQD